MNVSELMTKEPKLLQETESLLNVAKKMKQFNCGIFPIEKTSEIIGVITDRDLITKAVAEGKDLLKTTVGQVMCKNPIFCEESEPLKKAIEKMNKHNIRRVLVQNKDKKLSGILSFGDITRKVKDKKMLSKLFE